MLPVLEFQNFLVDFVNVNVSPENIVITVDGFHDSVVKSVKLLQQIELLFSALQMRIFSDLQSKKLFASVVSLKLPPQIIESKIK